jgi:hypothetical protein
VLIFRALVPLLLVAGLLCFGLYLGTKQTVWLQRASAILRWTIMAVLALVGVFLLERLALLA